LVVGSHEWHLLRAVARKNKIAVGTGYSEREGNYLCMGQALINAKGHPIIVRRKVCPSGAERAIWSDASMSELKVVPTKLGRLGMLECWEHLHPQITFDMLARKENLHIAAWPYKPAEGAPVQFWEDISVARFAVKMYALQGGTYALLPSVGHAEVFDPLGQSIAKADGNSTADMVHATIDPAMFSELARDPKGEFSWGVLKMIEHQHPGPRVRDTEHQNLNMVPLPQ
jgi:nitrilase